MTRVELMQGVPGAGKTYALHARVEQHLRNGDRIKYLNFTNAGTKATKEELAGENGNDPLLDADLTRDEETVSNLADRITGTLHGEAFRLAKAHGLIEDAKVQVIMPTDADRFPYAAQRGEDAGPNLYKAFCGARGLDFHVSPNTPMDAVLRNRDDPNGIDYRAAGNALMAINHWLHMRYPPSVDRPEKAAAAPVDIGIPWSRVRTLLHEWREFKQELEPSRYEHADYIDAVIENGWTPRANVLCVDEYQDLSPLEHLLLREWINSGNLKSVYLAGDRNQSIYSFRGADPEFLAATDADTTTTLTESRRCASEISAVASELVTALSNTADISSHADAPANGTLDITSVGAGHDCDLADVVDAALQRHDSVMVLARTNRVAAMAAKHLRKDGVMYGVLGNGDAAEDNPTPYRSGGSAPAWPVETRRVVPALRRLRDGKLVAESLAEDLLEALPRGDARVKALRRTPYADDTGSVNAYTAGDVVEKIGEASTVADIIDLLDLKTDARREWVRAAALHRDARPHANRCKIGTVHASKGLTTDCVLLLDEYPWSIAKRYANDSALRAEERRVAYVAVTRARHEFQLVRGFGNDPSWPMFRGGIPGVGQVRSDATVNGGETA